MIGLALAASVFIKELPLRDTAFADEQAFDEPNQNVTERDYAPNRHHERREP
jgi:hypothetical protein